MSVNVNKFVGKIYEKGYNKTSFASNLKISRETLRAYIKNPRIRSPMR